MENVNAPNLSDPWGVFLVGAFLFAVILVSEYRCGGEHYASESSGTREALAGGFASRRQRGIRAA